MTPESVLIAERLNAVKDIPLAIGGHTAPTADEVPGAFCVMEKFAYVTGQAWTDHPKNCCPTIGAYLRRLNDVTDQPMRDAVDAWVIGNADRIVRTADDGHKRERGYLAADWAVRTALPVWLDAAGATEAAERVRGLAEITDAKTASLGRNVIREVRKGLPDYWAWRSELREKVSAAVLKALKDRPTNAAAATADDAAADAATNAAADAATATANAAGGDRWQAIYDAVYKAVRERLFSRYEDRWEKGGDVVQGGVFGSAGPDGCCG